MQATPPLVVAGCPRGGTSLFAKLLVAAGLTTVQDARATEKYPSGFFEHVPLLMFHKAMERFPREGSLHRSDYVATTDPFLHARYLGDPFVRTMAREAFAPLVDGSVDFLKYPQLALSTDFLFETLGEDLRVVLVWRDPVPSVLSLSSKEFGRDLWPFRGLRSVWLWCTYAYHVVRAKERYGRRVAVVHIDRVVEGASATDRLLAPLGVRVAATSADRVMTPGVWTRGTSRSDRARVAALDGLAARLAPRLGADPALTGLERWAARLADVSEPC